MISPEQQEKIVAQAQARFASFKQRGTTLDEAGLDLLFAEARSQNGWQDRAISDELLQQLYDLTKMGATSMNCCPARFVFVRTDEGKEKLRPNLLPNNVDKVMTAPVVAIIGHDGTFYEKLGFLFPHMDAKPLFAGNAELAGITAFRNGTLQGAYLMLAARALGLDCGPMSGFDNNAVDEAFFAGTSIKSNFLCGLGYGEATKIFQRLPRLDFDEACELA